MDLLKSKGDRVLHFKESPERASDWERALQEQPKAWAHFFDAAPTLAENEIPEQARRNIAQIFTGMQTMQSRFQEIPPVWCVTRGAVRVNDERHPVRLESAPLWGLGRSLFWENAGVPFRCVDLSALSEQEEVEFLSEELSSPDEESQIARREGKRWAPRLERESCARTSEASLAPRLLEAQEPFRLEILEAGTLEGARARRCVRKAPQAGEIEIEVAAAGLNFSDVLKVLGLYPGLRDTPVPLGAECAGRVSAVGPEVRGFQVGDEVMAIAPFSFGRYVTTAAELAVLKPRSMNFAEAAALPVAFLTAYYALHHLARLQKGERVLIHAAAGGVGLAALQIAQYLGAEVFATAGSEEKRQFLRARGVKHVMDSRSLDFVREIMEITGGRGVDVVLNSLSGEFIPKSLQVLAPYGRFLEIGKTDIYQDSRVGLAPFQNSLAYFAIDLDRMFRDRRAFIARLFSELAERFEQGNYHALPRTDFKVSEATAAFRYMAQRKNTGKIVLLLEGERVSALEASASEARVNPEGVYLVTGANGALGRLVAQDLVRQGARRLALLGRRAPDAAVSTLLQEWRAEGVEAQWFSVDVADASALHSLFEGQVFLRELRGVFHCAGTLADGLLLQQSWENFSSALSAKLEGAWNLHDCTRGHSLEHFVLFSSMASLLGSPGQANYAAANAFLDALAAERRRQGLPGLSINWGPWAGEGMADAEDVRRNLARRGLRPLRAPTGLAALHRLLGYGDAQAAVADVEWETLQRGLSPRNPVPMLEQLLQSVPSAPQKISVVDSQLRDKLALLDPDRRQSSLQLHIHGQVARVLGIDPSRLDPTQSLNALGLDSLMAIELKNEIEGGLQVVIPIATLLKGPSLVELATQLVPQLDAREGGA